MAGHRVLIEPNRRARPLLRDREKFELYPASGATAALAHGVTGCATSSGKFMQRSIVACGGQAGLNVTLR